MISPLPLSTNKFLIYGRFNEALTLDELQQYSISEKKWLILNLQSSLQYGIVHPDIEAKFFVSQPCKYEYDALEPLTEDTEINPILEEIYSNYQATLQDLKDLRYTVHKEQGNRIWVVQNELNFRGEFEMTLPQLEGYISAMGQVNYFEPEHVIAGLNKLDKSVPSRQPGFGFCPYQWSIRGENIFLTVSYCDQVKLDHWVKWYTEAALQEKDTLKASTMKYVVKQHESVGFAFTLVLWWE